MDRSEAPDEELARRYVENNDEHAFRELVRRMAPLTRRLFMALFCGAIDDVEDAEQETLSAMVTALRAFDGKSSARTFWYRVARNSGIDILRDRGRQRRIRSRLASPEIVSLRLPAERPEERLLQKETLRDYYRSLSRLPEEDRLLVHLFYVEEQSIAQVAESVGMPTGTVKSKLHRIRRRLQKQRNREDGQKQ